MATNSRLIKPANYPSLTPEQMCDDAIRFINANIRGWHTGAERREIARASANPALREAARILDERDAAAAAERERTVMAAGSAPCEVGDPAQNTEPVVTPRPSMASAHFANRRVHGADGKYIPAKFVRQWEPVRRLLQDLRESKGGTK